MTRPSLQIAAAAKRLHVVDMDIFALFDIDVGNTDGLAVLHDVFAGLDVADCDLVTVGHVADDVDLVLVALFIVNDDFGAVCHALGEDRRDVVQIVDP